MGNENKDNNSSKWDHIKHFIFKYVGTLFMDSKETKDPKTGEITITHVMSLGRVSFVVMLAHALWIWSGMSNNETNLLPDGEKEVLFALLAYNFTTKGVNALKKKNGNGK